MSFSAHLPPLNPRGSSLLSNSSTESPISLHPTTLPPPLQVELQAALNKIFEWFGAPADLSLECTSPASSSAPSHPAPLPLLALSCPQQTITDQQTMALHQKVTF
eukprot:4725969-Ditylum_brightwellii.AAC.1